VSVLTCRARKLPKKDKGPPKVPHYKTLPKHYSDSDDDGDYGSDSDEDWDETRGPVDAWVEDLDLISLHSVRTGRGGDDEGRPTGT
jgi:hypothetical protein